jgi:RNA polymerase sigma-70 factor (ECF subfamily)
MDEKTRQAARYWALAQPVVSAFITSVVRDFSARDDVLQETAVAVLESFDRYQPDQSFVGWALGIARHKVQHYLRRVRRDRHLFDDKTVAHLFDAFELTSAEKPRRLQFLGHCLQTLNPQALRLCELRYCEDLGVSEIANRVAMSPNNVAKILQRSRDQLRECIQRKVSLEEVTS